MSITFSFRYNSSSLRFGLIPWQFQNKMFKPMKVIKEYLSWMTKVLVVRKFKIDCQGFVFGYDIEITIPIFFVHNYRPCFTRKATPTLWPVERSNSIITRDVEI